MRNGQNNNNKNRMRNRNNGGGGGGGNNNNNNNNRRGQNPMTRVFESNGPDIKIRGTASHVAEKYVQLARDARSSGDPVAAENYYQHAEHYFRLIATAQEQFRQTQPLPRADGSEMPQDDSNGDDESESYSNFGAEPGFAPQPPQPAFQPREAQPYQPREQQQPREHRPQYQQPQPQPAAPALDSLPSFITGPQPQVNGPGFDANGGGERFPPRRRRRPHGPRPDAAAAPAVPSDDFNPGNS